MTSFISWNKSLLSLQICFNFLSLLSFGLCLNMRNQCTLLLLCVLGLGQALPSTSENIVPIIPSNSDVIRVFCFSDNSYDVSFHPDIKCRTSCGYYEGQNSCCKVWQVTEDTVIQCNQYQNGMATGKSVEFIAPMIYPSSNLQVISDQNRSVLTCLDESQQATDEISHSKDSAFYVKYAYLYSGSPRKFDPFLTLQTVELPANEDTKECNGTKYRFEHNNTKLWTSLSEFNGSLVLLKQENYEIAENLRTVTVKLELHHWILWWVIFIFFATSYNIWTYKQRKFIHEKLHQYPWLAFLFPWIFLERFRHYLHGRDQSADIDGYNVIISIDNGTELKPCKIHDKNTPPHIDLKTQGKGGHSPSPTRSKAGSTSAKAELLRDEEKAKAGDVMSTLPGEAAPVQQDPVGTIGALYPEVAPYEPFTLFEVGVPGNEGVSNTELGVDATAEKPKALSSTSEMQTLNLKLDHLTKLIEGISKTVVINLPDKKDEDNPEDGSNDTKPSDKEAEPGVREDEIDQLCKKFDRAIVLSPAEPHSVTTNDDEDIPGDDPIANKERVPSTSASGYKGSQHSLADGFETVNAKEISEDTDTIFVEGQLERKVERKDKHVISGTSWQRSWARVRRGSILFYSNKSDFTFITGNPPAKEELEGCTVGVTQDHYKKGNNIFRLETATGSSYRLKAASETKMYHWINMIEVASYKGYKEV